MKKIIRSKVFIVVLLLIIGVSSGVGATLIYKANQISYTPTDSTWNVTDVESALNELYDKQVELENTNTLTLLDTFSGVQTKTYTVPEGTTVDDVIVDISSISISSYGSAAWADVAASNSGELYSKSISGTTLTVKTKSISCSAQVGTISTQGYAHSSGTGNPGSVKVYIAS